MGVEAGGGGVIPVVAQENPIRVEHGNHHNSGSPPQLNSPIFSPQQPVHQSLGHKGGWGLSRMHSSRHENHRSDVTYKEEESADSCLGCTHPLVELALPP